MARTFADDDVDFYRVTTFNHNGFVLDKFGPYDTYGKAKSQGTRLTGNGFNSDPAAKTFTVQKLEAVMDMDYSNMCSLRWVDVDG